ncbi:unnamed protein product [Bursaphelenchus okinawaensis]|uniref:Uncharacterized protein n=1 Tax=Bursaphelenchus okinawaensis TaxID=465554 RepID=A0A811JUS4_9BILA|nr:unnamed protein product [Bursaphelenchus okinawaensis]CAG9084202.1 unnamed protein product [Bursaphelenchus okinawaensis]
MLANRDENVSPPLGYRMLLEAKRRHEQQQGGFYKSRSFIPRQKQFSKKIQFPTLKNGPLLQFVVYYTNRVVVQGNKVVFQHSSPKTIRLIRLAKRTRDILFKRVTSCEFKLNNFDNQEIYFDITRYDGESVRIRVPALAPDLLGFKDVVTHLRLPFDFIHISKNKRFKVLDDIKTQFDFCYHHMLAKSRSLQSISCDIHTFQNNHQVICESAAKKLTLTFDRMLDFPGLANLGIYNKIQKLELFCDINDVIKYDGLFKRIFQCMKALKIVYMEPRMDVFSRISEADKWVFLIQFCRCYPFLKYNIRFNKPNGIDFLKRNQFKKMETGEDLIEFYKRSNIEMVFDMRKIGPPPEYFAFPTMDDF